MDKFDNSIPSPDQFTKDAGMASKNIDIEEAIKDKAIDASRADMERGFSESDFNAPTPETDRVVGRLPFDSFNW